jgi:hypothetical protein
MRTLALFACACLSSGAPAPLLVVLGSGAEPWTAGAAARGWEVAAIPEALPNDNGVRSIEAAIESARKRREIDPDRTYLAGEGASSAAVFYAVSRRPDLWAAAIPAEGGPAPAIETNRLFGANAALVPLLWAIEPQERATAEPMKARLAASGFDLELRTESMSVSQALDWLASHKREPFPPKIDCETGNLEFARCYWASIVKFDPAQRNDILPSSRVQPGSGAYLAPGGFGFDLRAPGPGVLVSWLPPNYSGPLKLEDRIVAVGGKPVQDARDYVRLMDAQTEERGVGVTVQRGKKRIRLESRIALAKREENLTARVQAEYLSDAREMQVITRGVGALRLTLPGYWTPCPINWNGNDAGKAETAGCWLLTPGAPARKCE